MSKTVQDLWKTDKDKAKTDEDLYKMKTVPASQRPKICRPTQHLVSEDEVEECKLNGQQIAAQAKQPQQRFLCQKISKPTEDRRNTSNDIQEGEKTQAANQARTMKPSEQDIIVQARGGV